MDELDFRAAAVFEEDGEVLYFDSLEELESAAPENVRPLVVTTREDIEARSAEPPITTSDEVEELLERLQRRAAEVELDVKSFEFFQLARSEGLIESAYLFSEINFAGDHRAFSVGARIPDLSLHNFDNRACSMYVTGCITLWDLQNYRGESRSFVSPPNVPLRAPTFGTFNRRASSLSHPA
jgi:hypothetical protein